MHERPIDPAALASSALAGVLAVILDPGAFNSIEVAVGLIVLALLFSYDAPVPRRRAQIIAFAGVAGFAAYVAMGFGLELLYAGKAYEADGPSQIPPHMAPKLWAWATSVAYLVQIVRIDLHATDSRIRRALSRQKRRDLPWRSPLAARIGWLLLLGGALIFVLTIDAPDASFASAAGNIAAELIGAAVAVLIIDRAVATHEGTKRRRELIGLLGATDRHSAKMARDELSEYQWLYDGYLDGVIFSEMNLAGLDLSRARLRAALFVRANLRGAWLINADLSGAVLTGADLSGAIVHPSVLMKAKNLLGATMPDGKRYAGQYALPADEKITGGEVERGRYRDRAEAYARYHEKRFTSPRPHAEPVAVAARPGRVGRGLARFVGAAVIVGLAIAIGKTKTR